MLKNKAEIKMSSLSENIGFARMAVATFGAQLEFTLAEIEEIKVAISEAVSNCIIHGYENQPKGDIHLAMFIQDNSLILIVEDFGIGIADVEEAMQPSFTTSEERMGLGMVFMNSFMNEMSIDSTPGEGTKVRMVKIPEKQR